MTLTRTGKTLPTRKLGRADGYRQDVVKLLTLPSNRQSWNDQEIPKMPSISSPRTKIRSKGGFLIRMDLQW